MRRDRPVGKDSNQSWSAGVEDRRVGTAAMARHSRTGDCVELDEIDLISEKESFGH